MLSGAKTSLKFNGRLYQKFVSWENKLLVISNLSDFHVNTLFKHNKEFLRLCWLKFSLCSLSIHNATFKFEFFNDEWTKTAKIHSEYRLNSNQYRCKTLCNAWKVYFKSKSDKLETNWELILSGWKFYHFSRIGGHCI